jgi:hypothetical protein
MPLRWRWLCERTPEHPLQVLELRVHGVHNTSPQSMLGVTKGEIGQVAGDGITGVFRTKDGKIPLRELKSNIAVEAYSWGALTSGVTGIFGWVRRVAWLFLLPFALLNISYWARPELGFRTEQTASGSVGPNNESTEELKRSARPSRSSARLLRVAGLLLTAFMVLTPLTVVVDLVAWQCYQGGTIGCPTLTGIFDLLAREHVNTVTRRLALASVPALLVILALWFLSRQSLARYEEVREPSELAPAEGESLLLRHPKLWSGTRRTRRLQRLHTAFALSVVVCYTGIPAVFTGGTPDWKAQHAYVVLGLINACAVALALTAVIMVLRTQPDDVEYTKAAIADRKQPRAPQLLLWLAWSLVVAHLAALWFPKFALDDNESLLGENVWFIAIFIALTCVNVMTFLVGRASMFTTVLAGIAVVILAVLSSTWVDDSSWDLWPHMPHDDWWWPVLRDDSWPHERPWLGVALIVLGVASLAWWHYIRYPARKPSAHAIAWNGAGASIFFSAASWVALLFTTSVVVLSANYLNGSGSVGDLGTKFIQGPQDTKPSPTSASLEAEGDVVVKGANILVKNHHITVRLGSVSVDSFHQLPTASNKLPSVGTEAISLPDQELRGATLKLPAKLEGKVTYENSCVFTVRNISDIDNGIDKRGHLRPCTGVTATTRSHSGTLVALQDNGQLLIGTTKPVLIRSLKPPQIALTLPQVLIWAPLGQLLWAVLAAVIAFACWCRLRRKRVTEAICEQLKADGNVSAEDEAACFDARMTAAFPHRGEKLLDLVGRATVALSIALILGSLTGKPPWELSYLGWTSSVATAALWVALGTATGLVWLASQVRKSESARKSVGILWDLTTFWPRAAHPFSPPCYAERVVPELLTRIKWATTDEIDGGGGANRVILSGHSQGSTLVIAAASRLPDHNLQKIRIVTYGSQIRTWYGRIFPAVFGPAAIGYVSTTGPATFGDPRPDAPVTLSGDPGNSGYQPSYTQKLEIAIKKQEGSLLYRLDTMEEGPCWVNLFRRTDPIGFRVFSDDDHRGQDTYVLEVPTKREGDPGPRVMTHGGYPHTAEYRQTILDWTGESLPADSRPRVAKPPFQPQP